MKNNPIGVFDSGVGGLSVLKEIRRLLPNESVVYFADSANCPYGSMDEKDANSLAKQIVGFLVHKGCKLIVVACNTVTAVAIKELRAGFDIPFIGMEPALKPAVMQTKTNKIGVLATQNTLNGNHFKQTRERYAKDVDLYIQPGYGLVELVEKGAHESDQAETLLDQYIGPMMEKGADTLVLGCTHYPFLSRKIEKVTQKKIKIIDSSKAVAAQTERVLNLHHLKTGQDALPSFSFYTTGATDLVEKMLRQTMDRPYTLQQVCLKDQHFKKEALKKAVK